MVDDDSHSEATKNGHGDTLNSATKKHINTLGGNKVIPGKLEIFWDKITQAGLKDIFLSVGNLLSILVVLFLAWAMRELYSKIQPRFSEQPAALAAPIPTPIPAEITPQLPQFNSATNNATHGLFRLASLVTTIPTRPRVDVITYTVKTGDSVFGIADMFGLKPETILWSNPILSDNPHRLQPDQVLNILPINGTYHKWSSGEDIQKVAEYYKIDFYKIIEWPGNPFDPFDFDPQVVSIEPGTMLIVPEGQREFIDYGPPRIPRDNPAVAQTYGPGYCGQIYDGAIGVGALIWPTTARWLSGYNYNPAANHSAIDIGGDTGDLIWSVDNGVIVYSGWSYSGYGNLIVIDHGNGWQSLYAHLDQIYVGCGTSVYQATTIATMGNTGNSSGSHLHLELMYEASRVNPWNFLQ